MTCPTCGAEYKRVCRSCQAARARQGMLLHQRRFLQTWLAGGIELRSRVFHGVKHLELFDDRWHSFCGVAMMTITARDKTRSVPADLCSACQQVFGELVGKARSEVR